MTYQLKQKKVGMFPWQTEPVVVVDLGGTPMELNACEIEHSIEAVKFNRIHFPNETFYRQTLSLYEGARNCLQNGRR